MASNLELPDRLKSWIAAVSGGATAVLTGGNPVVSVAVGSATTTVVDLAVDLIHRRLSKREEERVLSVVEIAAQAIEQLRAAGGEIRDDDWFETTQGDRGSAAEVAEAVLVAAQQTTEERKLLHLGWLLASLAYRPGVDRATANHLIRLLSDLSFRQYVLLYLSTVCPLPQLRLVGDIRRDAVNLDRRTAEILDDALVASRQDALAVETSDLRQGRGLLTEPPGANQKAIATDFGGLVVEMARLDLIDKQEVAAVRTELFRRFGSKDEQ